MPCAVTDRWNLRRRQKWTQATCEAQAMFSYQQADRCYLCFSRAKSHLLKNSCVLCIYVVWKLEDHIPGPKVLIRIVILLNSKRHPPFMLADLKYMLKNNSFKRIQLFTKIYLAIIKILLVCGRKRNCVPYYNCS